MINFRNSFIILISMFAVGLLLPALGQATSSERFFRRDGHILDNWGVWRTSASGLNGFLALTSSSFDPVITRESLGENSDLAWQLGEEFTEKYQDTYQKAEEIFYYVRDSVVYTSDTDQFGMGEFAQNADEMAQIMIGNKVARGDCEDSAILLAVMYKAAGYRSAMVLMPGHVATLVYLPGYRKASRKLTLGGEAGWVWAEATGATNPFGWVPDSLLDGEVIAREVTIGQIKAQEGELDVSIPDKFLPEKRYGASNATGAFGLIGTAGFLWVVASGRRSAQNTRRRR